VSEAHEKAQAILKAERDLVKRVFNTPDGKRLLKLLSERHVRSPIADFSSPERTSWRLGQAELIINLINILESKDE
jgi:hypothetical protein